MPNVCWEEMGWWAGLDENGMIWNDTPIWC